MYFALFCRVDCTSFLFRRSQSPTPIVSLREENSRCVAASVHIDEVTPRLSFWAHQHHRRGSTTLAGHGYPRRCRESTNSSVLSKSNKRAWRCSTTPLLPSLGCLIIAVETRPSRGTVTPAAAVNRLTAASSASRIRELGNSKIPTRVTAWKCTTLALPLVVIFTAKWWPLPRKSRSSVNHH